MNGVQDGTPYSGPHEGNIPEFMPLDNSLNRDILHSFHFHCVLSRFFARRGGMSKFCCIPDLILFMMKEAEKLIKGSVHEDDFFIVHDALVLMRVKETIKWMRENNYFHSWLLPINGLQDGTTYSDRPIGNSPKFMPLNNSLNRDILHNFLF